jgi:uncharacterized protein YicC (UPF0701 family)
MLNDIIEQSIDRIVEQKVGPKLDETINDFIAAAIKKEFESQIKTKVTEAIKSNMQSLDSLLKDMKSIDKSLETYIKKYQEETSVKIKAAMDKIDIKLNLTAIMPTLNQKLGQALMSHISYNSDTYGKLIGAKVREYLEKNPIFPK